MSRAKSEEKEKILLNGGYKYHFERMIYFNLKTKKVFSFEAVDDHPVAWLQERMNKNNKHEWEFYWSIETPNDRVKQDVIRELTYGK